MPGPDYTTVVAILLVASLAVFNSVCDYIK